MDTFRAAGSDRKLSELGLDLPDFLDSDLDPAELYSSSSLNSSSLASFDFCSDRIRSPHQFQNFTYQHEPGYHHNPNHSNSQHLQQTLQHSRSGVKDASNTYFVVDNRMSGNNHSRYAHNNAAHGHDNDDDPLNAELQLVDVVNDGDADDDEVVLSNGWLDDILDDDDDDVGSQPENHVACAAVDDHMELQHVSDEHSYSLSNDTADNGLESFDVKIETDYIDIEGGLFEMINPADMTLLNGTEITSAVAMSGGSDDFVMSSSLRTRVVSESDDIMIHAIVKSEPLDAASTDSCYSMSPGHSHVSSYDVSDNVDLPLTPPGSNSCSSESEAGGLSPRRSPSITPSSPRHVITAQRMQQHHLHHQASSNGGGMSQHNVWTASLSTGHHQPFPANPIPTSGILILSEEEKRTLVAEGYPVPSKLPLTKQEEKNLKKIRRKIKNKISAQESRRKKKEYLETLEKKVEVVSIENISLRKKIDLLENNNRSLASQLQKLQSLASKLTTQMQAASCIAVN